MGAQVRLLTCPFNEIFYGGAKGGGKSDGGLGMWLKHWARNPQHASGVIFRKTYPQLGQIIKRSKELFKPLGAVWKEQAKTWYFPGGATVLMRFLASVDDAAEYQGHEYTFIWFDEVGDIGEEEIINTLRGALRSSKPIDDRILLLTGNPMGKGHKWLVRRFIMEPDGKTPRTPETPITDTMVVKARNNKNKTITWSRVFIPALLEDNPALMDQDPGYEMRLEQMCVGKPWLLRALRFGDWTVKRELPGALVTQAQIDKQCVPVAPPLRRGVVGVDPTVKGYDPEKPQDELDLELGDECGIIAYGAGGDGKRYFLADETVKADPTVWAKRAVQTAVAWGAKTIVAEKNNGGELVKIQIKAAMKEMGVSDIEVKLVPAQEGKYIRAHPCAMDIVAGNLFFVGDKLEKLKEEWTTWVPDGKHASPNRIDAAVWAWIEDVLGLDTRGVLQYYEGLVQREGVTVANEVKSEVARRLARVKELMDNLKSASKGKQ